MRESKLISGLAGLVIVGAVASLAHSWGGGFAPHLKSEPHEAAGWMMAQQTLKCLKPGSPVYVLARDTAQFKNPATDLQLAAFRKELAKAHAQIASLQLLQVDPLRPVEVPPGDFLEWIRKAPPGSVVVSFMGPPLLTAAQCRRLKESRPSVVAFCSGSQTETVDLQALFRQGVLHAAVVSRRQPTDTPAKPRGRQAWFDRYFVVVTAADVGQRAWLSEATRDRRTP